MSSPDKNPGAASSRMAVRSSVPRDEPVGASSEPGIGIQPLVTAIAVVAALYFGSDIFVPLALALLFTFALSPLVSVLRKVRVPRIPAVVLVVTGALFSVALFGAVVASQLGTLAQNLPSYQYNITQKVRAIREASVGDGIVQRASRLLESLGREIDRSEDREDPQGTEPAGTEAEPRERQPIEVLIREPAMAPLQLLTTIVGPLIEPVATGGIVIVVVIFMLIRREDLRDRFIRLVGAHDLQRTTTALQDAGRRVGQYLLMQLVVNVTYAVPIAMGLWLIGVPNALLWGLLCLVLRFIPYIGPIIGALFPLALSIAVDPGWTMFLWTAALFVTLELISNNFVEPWLYGSRTGLSPVAVIISAIFWTWLWGPVGLLLSTPLTVCLVVLGRHVPQFRFLDVLLGNEPVLTPAEQLYQRLLAGRPEEATETAEELLREETLLSLYDGVAMKTLVLAEQDRSRGVLDDLRRERVAEGVETLAENLSDHEDGSVTDEAEEAEADADPDRDGLPSVPAPMPDIACAGGRGNLDDAAAVMVADILERAGADVTVIEHDELASARTMRTDLAGKDMIVVGYLNSESTAHARYLVRRLRRQRQKAILIIGFWADAPDPDRSKALRDKLGCDHVVNSIGEILALARDLATEDQAEEVAVEAEKPKRKAPARRPRAATSTAKKAEA